jgi:hypothetical protein
MSRDTHREADELSAAAAIAVAEGRSRAARELYAWAAHLEEVALAQVPLDQVRDRGILSVSVASLLYKAQLLARAEEAIFRFLGSGELDPLAEGQLRELLEVVSTIHSGVVS